MTKIIISFLLASINLNAATYYFDFAGGSDSNTGTNSISPWKRHPYMSGYTGHYVHVSGDRFIFKGGVTWDKTCFPLDLYHNLSGASDSIRDYYGVNGTWFTGTNWTRPIFNGEGSIVNMFFAPYRSYFNIDSLEINNAAGDLIALAQATSITITNCKIHGYLRLAGGDDSFSGTHGIANNYAGAGIQKFLITHCEIGNDGSVSEPNDHGCCIRGGGEIAFCKLYGGPWQILFGGYSIHDCDIGTNNASYSGDAAAHPDVIYWAIQNGSLPYTSPIYCYNNLIHDIRGPGVPVIYTEPCFGQAPNTVDVYIYNTVVINSASSPALPDNEGYAGGKNINIHFWNDTFHLSGVNNFPVVNNTSHGGPRFDWEDFRNCHFIYENGGSEYTTTIFNTITKSNLISMTLSQAQNAGYYISNYFQPTITNQFTTGKGIDLSIPGVNLPDFSKSTSAGGHVIPIDRPVGSWDVGAFQFDSQQPKKPVSPTGVKVIN